MSYGNKDGADPQDSPADATPGATTVTELDERDDAVPAVDEAPAERAEDEPAPVSAPPAPAPARPRPAPTVIPAVPAPAAIGGRSRPLVLLGGAAAVLVVFGLVMTGLFVFKSNQLTESDAKLATAQSALAARNAKATDAEKQLSALQSKLTDAQNKLSGAQRTAASDKANRATVKQCLSLVEAALTTARTGSSNQLDQALKRLKAPCAKANKVA